MISKELTSRLLGLEHIWSIEKNPHNENEIHIRYNRKTEFEFGRFSNANIYELAHKCKEWALKYDCMLNSWYTEEQPDSSLGQMVAVCNIYHSFTSFEDIVKSFEADTEPEVIFKACQWILDNKAN